MNIFLFDENLQANAVFFKMKDPLRFNKQILESTQLFAASVKFASGIDVLKSDGTPYTVNRILHHPACKWLLKDIDNHYWHINYLRELLKLKPDHSCGKSFIEAMNKINTFKDVTPKEYLCITNSDMSGLENATVFEKYKRHLDNKHKGLV